MNATKQTTKERILAAFEAKFSAISNKFEIIDLLSNGSPMDYDTIDTLKLPSEDYNIVWHPGVYAFIGNDSLYRVGRSLQNSRARVMQHLEACTARDGHSIWDIDKYADKAILLFNVKDPADKHWLAALEVYFEINFHPLIKAGRIG